MFSFRAINQPSDNSLTPSPGERSTSNSVSRQSLTTDGGQASALSPRQAACAMQEKDKVEKQRCPQVILPVKITVLSPKQLPVQPGPPSTARSLIPPDRHCRRQSKRKDNAGQVVADAKRAKRSSKKKADSRPLTPKARRQQACREKKLMLSIEHSAQKRATSSSPVCDIDEATGSEYIPSPTKSAHVSPSSASGAPFRRSPRKHALSYPNNESTSGTLTAATKENDTAAPGSSQELKAAITPRPPSPAMWNAQLRRKKYKEAEYVELPREVFEYEEAKKKLAVKKENMLAERRKEKGKFVERRSVEETHGSTQKTDKRRVEEDEQNKPRKRHKSKKSQETESLASKQMSAPRRAQKYEAVVAKAEDRLDITDVRSYARCKARRHSSEGSMKERVQRSFESQVPEERAGQAGGQTSRDSGQHKRPPNEGWRKPYLRREVSVPKTSHQSDSEDQIDDTLRRAQSSIPPPAFYGHESRYRPRTTPAKTLKVNGVVKGTSNPNSALVDNASGCSTLPNSLPLGIRRGVDNTTLLCENENDVRKRIPTGLPAVSTGRHEPQHSFLSRRIRHQSMPVDLSPKNNSVNESDPSPQSTRRRPEFALQDISHNAILRKITDFQALVLARLPETPRTQSTVVPPETITPAATGAPRGENRAGPSRVRKKRPSKAERQLRQPALDRNVPVHLRLTDDEIIEVGRIVNHYERHVKAQQAFSWHGRLYSDYKHLITRHHDGRPVWTAEQINRMR